MTSKHPFLQAALALTAVSAAFGAATAEAQLAACAVNHCSDRWVQINDACIPAGFAGKPFPVVDLNGGVCTCPCSCVTGETTLRLADGTETPFASVRFGQSAFNPYDADKPSAIAHLLRSDVTDAQVHEITFDNGSRLTASPNHTLVTPDERVVSLHELRVDDEVLDAEGEVTALTQNDKRTLSGTLYNVVVNKESARALDHVVVTNGVQSGDWLLQSANDILAAEIDLRTGVIPLPASR